MLALIDDNRNMTDLLSKGDIKMKTTSKTVAYPARDLCLLYPVLFISIHSEHCIIMKG